MSSFEPIRDELRQLEALFIAFLDEAEDQEMSTERIERLLEARRSSMARIAEITDSIHNEGAQSELSRSDLERLNTLAGRIDANALAVVQRCRAEQEHVREQMHKLRSGRVAIRGYGADSVNRTRNGTTRRTSRFVKVG